MKTKKTKYSFEDFNIRDLDPSQPKQWTVCPRCSLYRKALGFKDMLVFYKRGSWICNNCKYTGSLAKSEPRRERWEKETQQKYENELAKGTKLKLKLKKIMFNKTDIEWFANRGISKTTILKYGIIKNHKAYFSRTKTLKYAYGFVTYSKYLNSVGERDILSVKWLSLEHEYSYYKTLLNYPYNWESLYINEKPVSSFIITEGEIDAISAIECGCKEVVSIPNGAPDIRVPYWKADIDYILTIKDVYSNADKVVLAFDNDANGQNLARILAEFIGYDKCYFVDFHNDCKDLNDVLLKYGKLELASMLKKPISCTEEYFLDRVVFTPWDDLSVFYAIVRGNIDIFYGIASHGTTTFLNVIALHLARMHDWKIALINAQKKPISEYIKSYEPFLKDLNIQCEKSDWVKQHFHVIDISNAKNMADFLITSLTKLIDKQRLKGVIIDPLEDILKYKPKNTSDYDYIKNIFDKLKKLATKRKIQIWVVTHATKEHFNKNGTSKISMIEDINEGEFWSEFADNIVCIYRENISNNNMIAEVQKRKFHEQMRSVKLPFVSFDYIKNSQDHAIISTQNKEIKYRKLDKIEHNKIIEKPSLIKIICNKFRCVTSILLRKGNYAPLSAKILKRRV